MNIKERTERFNETIRLLNEQGAQAFNACDLICEYKTAGGLKCAVGLWIPEGHPSQSHEGSYEGLLVTHPDLEEILGVTTNKDATLYQELQSLHDEGCNWVDGGLDPAIVDEVGRNLRKQGVIE